MNSLPALSFSLIDVSLHIIDHLVIGVDVVPVPFEFLQILGLKFLDLIQGSQTVLILLSDVLLLFFYLVDSKSSFGDRIFDGYFQLYDSCQLFLCGCDVGVKFPDVLV